jgi:hypothetical protein
VLSEDGRELTREGQIGTRKGTPGPPHSRAVLGERRGRERFQFVCLDREREVGISTLKEVHRQIRCCNGCRQSLFWMGFVSLFKESVSARDMLYAGAKGGN